jgi:hypothetical protein
VSNYLTSFCVEYLRWVLALICSTKVI